ncbi:NUDIX hydrolase [Aestuariivivens sediminis]|uniref:NUDIX hydrolase n=1 Tax=Aestuariivivens sediminis TaxID=2913557 RepID=UPI001F5AE950|nr:hypothetical protein [Aestuariivivens sediminis]
MKTSILIFLYFRIVANIKKFFLLPYLYSISKRFVIKIILLVLCTFAFSIQGISQQENYSHFKLTITNASDEILLVKYKGIWELPGMKYIDSRKSIREFTNLMAEEIGITFKDLSLRGLFTIYKNDVLNPVIFNYYSGRYEWGDLKVPPGCTDVAWFSLDEALNVIPIKHMKMILKKIFEKKSYVWGASMHISIYEDRKLDKWHVNNHAVTIKEDFYPLSE